ncbi:endoribonuclease MazF [Kordiimonas sp.]|uniref:endoribonuclease MazF n=1 Tax=Kordiimonas sp. TaxID=1970157 RepID=UPI003A8FA370
MSAYIPEAGDIVWLEFSPHAGHEQAGHRPALVISPAVYNGRRGMMVCCPLTSQIKGYPFEVAIDSKSVVLSDQVKSLDWKARNASFKGKAKPAVLSKVRGNIKALLGLK